MRFLSTTTGFGTPLDTTVAEPAIVPADAPTAVALQGYRNGGSGAGLNGAGLTGAGLVSLPSP